MDLSRLDVSAHKDRTSERVGRSDLKHDHWICLVSIMHGRLSSLNVAFVGLVLMEIFELSYAIWQAGRRRISMPWIVMGSLYFMWLL